MDKKVIKGMEIEFDNDNQPGFGVDMRSRIEVNTDETFRTGLQEPCKQIIMG
jgi:hypothetical protein